MITKNDLIGQTIVDKFGGIWTSRLTESDSIEFSSESCPEIFVYGTPNWDGDDMMPIDIGDAYGWYEPFDEVPLEGLTIEDALMNIRVAINQQIRE